MQHEIAPVITYAQPGLDLQRPFDAAVVIQTLMRDSLSRAVSSIYEQDLDGTIQILIGIDDPKANRGPLLDLIKLAPSNIVVTIFDPGYSTFVSNGGLHPAYGGVIRTVLSYAANSRYVAYLDDDNWWAPPHLTSLIAAIKGYDWAFSLRIFVDSDKPEILVVDDWESVGPGGGIFNSNLGGFVDTSSLMIDKFACEPVLRLWSIPGQADGKCEDRVVFDVLKNTYPFNCTFRPTSYYTIDKSDPIHVHRKRFLDAVTERLKAGKPQSIVVNHLPERIREGCRQWVLRNLPKHGIGVEVGVWRGYFSALLLEHAATEILHLVDPWRHRDEPEYAAAAYGGKGQNGQSLVDDAYDYVCRRFEDRVANGSVVIHRKTSIEAAAEFKDSSLDWVYIDGDHHYHNVIADLKTYLPKVKDGGWIAGDGLDETSWWGDGVRRAVEEFLYSGGVELVKIAGSQFVLKKCVDALPEPMNPPLATRREPVSLSIKTRFRRGPFEVAAPRDFKFNIEATVNIGELQQNDHLSLYCLDDREKQFFFVETEDSEALERSPFMYQTQFEQATGLFAVPYERVKEIAAPIESPPIFILSIGRAGSTLLSKLFNIISEVRSFSEPDVFTQIANLRLQETRKAGRKRDSELVELISSATRCLQPIGGAYHQRRLVIKHRSQACALSDLFVQALPQAKIIFLHRQAESWARSAARAFGYPARQLASLWRSGLRGYECLKTDNADVLNVSYEALASDGIATFRRILDFCAVSLPEDRDVLQRILDRDSQRDTSISRTELKFIDRNVDVVVQQFLHEIDGQEGAFQE